MNIEITKVKWFFFTDVIWISRLPCKKTSLTPIKLSIANSPNFHFEPFVFVHFRHLAAAYIEISTFDKKQMKHSFAYLLETINYLSVIENKTVKLSGSERKIKQQTRQECRATFYQMSIQCVRLCFSLSFGVTTMQFPLQSKYGGKQSHTLTSRTRVFVNLSVLSLYRSHSPFPCVYARIWSELWACNEIITLRYE